MEQKLLALTEHLSSLQVFSGVCVARLLVFCLMFCRSLFVLLILFFRPFYYLSFRFAASDYLFGNFKLFLTVTDSIFLWVLRFPQ